MNKFEFLKNIKFGKPKVGQIIFWMITVALSAIVFFAANNIVQCWTFTKLPGITPEQCGKSADKDAFVPTNDDGTIQDEDAPPPVGESSVPEADLPPSWDGASRINILFIGLDERDLNKEEGPPRTDTMIVFSIDPVSMTAGMLSIPRDIWVNIPGFGYSRINTAYPSGEGSKLPGGGPALAMRTVSQFIGIPLEYYVQVDFNVFVAVADELMKLGGCIDVHPTENLILDPIGAGTDKVVMTAGDRQICDGKILLAYARNRHTENGDTDRSRRQQEVIIGLKKILSEPKNFPKFIQHAGALYKQLGWGIKTNMAFEDALKLAVLGKDISTDNIKSGVIDPKQGMAIFDKTTLGGQDASVLKPVMDKIRVLRDEIFTTDGPTSPLAVPSGYTDANLFAQAMQQEQARVRIMDGTFSGLDQRAGALFQSYGMNITEVAASPETYAQTQIIVYGPSLYTLKWLQAAFGIADRQIRFSPDPNQSVDVEIRLGSDLSGSIP